jgi:cytochrome c-type biogenesis protein CcmE
VTARGTFNGTQLKADTLLVKCPTKYQGTETKEYGSSASAGAAPGASLAAGSAARPSFGN